MPATMKAGKLDFLAELREAGYTNATTTGRGLAGPGDDLFLLPRVGIWRTTHMIRFFQKCLTGHEDRRRG